MPSYIIAARRTPIGRFLGALTKKSAVDLAVAAGHAVLENIDRTSIDQVILGNVLGAGLGMNIARQVGVKLGLPLERPAHTVNMMCASGLHAIALADQAIRAGDAHVILCGGTESMSNAPYLLDRARTGYKFGDATLVDSMLRDGLTCAFDQQHMGLTAERLVTEYSISRADQDAFAAESQQRYGRAVAAGAFTKELVALPELAIDEHPRPDTTAAKLATLKPAFNPTGTVTAGNASGVNDGAAMLLVASEAAVKKFNFKPLARIVASTAIGCDPARMGLGPVHAVRLLLHRMDVSIQKFDAVEINEAFAAQALSCAQELAVDPALLNSHGGAIALGHPIGASGARLVTHLAQRIGSGDIRRGLASLCVGGGMGVAMALESA